MVKLPKKFQYIQVIKVKVMAQVKYNYVVESTRVHILFKKIHKLFT